MKLLKFLVLGTLFGIVMAKSEAFSWFRIQEMFRFQAFHMYGIIGTAVTLGVIGVALIKKYNLRDVKGNPILFYPKDKSTKELLPKQEKIADFCPEAALCFTNPFDKRQVCVCMPPAPTVRSGQPIKTVWRFISVR